MRPPGLRQRLRPRAPRRRRRGSPTRRDAVAVHLHDPAKPRELRPRLAEQVRANERAGWTVEALAGPRRRGRRPRRLRRRLRADDAPRRAPPSATSSRRPTSMRCSRSSAAGCCRRAPRRRGRRGRDRRGQRRRSCTTSSAAPPTPHASASPFKNVVVAMLDLADELGLPLNLGGGVAAGRRPRASSSAASRTPSSPFLTHEVVCDPVAYAELSGDRDAGGLLPRLPGLSARSSDRGRRRSDPRCHAGRVRAESVGGGWRRAAARLDPRLDHAPDRRDLDARARRPGRRSGRSSRWPMTLLRRTRRPAG